MNNKFIKLTILGGIAISAFSLLHNCASISPPPGGKKDLKAPMLVYTSPLHKETNFKKDKIEYTFNERIDGKDLKNNLIINPKINGEYETSVDNEKLTIKFPKKYLANNPCKTYAINLREGIKDANEGNKFKMDKLVFSNCDKIDTAQIEGFVLDAYSRDSLKNIFIGIYTYTDTLNIETQKPEYYGFTNEKGYFFMNYIKAGIYKILAFDDKNKSQTYESKKEKLGFLKDNVFINDSIQKIELLLSMNDIKKPKVNAIKNDAEISIKFDDPIYKYELTIDSSVSYQINDKANEIIIHKNKFDKDSIPLKLYLQDSSYNDTTYSFNIIRNDSSKIKHIKNILLNKSGESMTLSDSVIYTFKFANPVKKIDNDKIYFLRDTLNKIQIDKRYYSFNKTKDEIKLIYPIKILPKARLELVAENKAFVSIKNDTNSKHNVLYNIVKPKNVEIDNSASFLIETNQKNYTIEILNQAGKIYYKTKNEKEIKLVNLPNGKYSVRAWIDENNDGRWNVGHYTNNTLPEKSYIFRNVIDVKTNWEIEDIHISF